MRARDIFPQPLFEDVDPHEQEIIVRLMTLLTTLHASKVPSVKVRQLKKSLQDAGFFVTTKWITDHLANINIVKDLSDHTVNFDIDRDEPEKEVGEPDQDQAEEKVSKMAKKALGRRT